MKRVVGSTETWEVCGLGGELVAEYAANGSPTSPQREYGYRNGQLLITATPTSGDVEWMVADQLGTPRMIFDKTGSLANTNRHDYMPFGEELLAPMSGWDSAHGYGAADGVRQHYTGYERDNETGLDYAHARYYGNVQGRFTSPDPFAGSATVAKPQTFNRYAYVGNNPVNMNDPTGMQGTFPEYMDMCSAHGITYNNWGSGSSSYSKNMDGGSGSEFNFEPKDQQQQQETQQEQSSDSHEAQHADVGGAQDSTSPSEEFAHSSDQRISPCSDSEAQGGIPVLIIARSIGGNESDPPSPEGHAALVFNFGTNRNNDHYLPQAGPTGPTDSQTVAGSVRQAGSQGWYDKFRYAEGGNWDKGTTREVPIEVKNTFYLSANKNTLSHINAINNSLNALQQKYTYQNGPNSNTYVHQFISRLYGKTFKLTPGGTMTLKGY